MFHQFFKVLLVFFSLFHPFSFLFTAILSFVLFYYLPTLTAFIFSPLFLIGVLSLTFARISVFPPSLSRICSCQLLLLWWSGSTHGDAPEDRKFQSTKRCGKARALGSRNGFTVHTPLAAMPQKISRRRGASLKIQTTA